MENNRKGFYNYRMYTESVFAMKNVNDLVKYASLILTPQTDNFYHDIRTYGHIRFYGLVYGAEPCVYAMRMLSI